MYCGSLTCGKLHGMLMKVGKANYRRSQMSCLMVVILLVSATLAGADSPASQRILSFEEMRAVIGGGCDESCKGDDSGCGSGSAMGVCIKVGNYCLGPDLLRKIAHKVCASEDDKTCTNKDVPCHMTCVCQFMDPADPDSGCGFDCTWDAYEDGC